MPINYNDTNCVTFDNGSIHNTDAGGTSGPGGYSRGDTGMSVEVSTKTGFAGMPIETPREMLEKLYAEADGEAAGEDPYSTHERVERSHDDDFSGHTPDPDVRMLESNYESGLRQIGSSVPSADIYEGLNSLAKGEDVPTHVVGAMASHMGLEPGEAMETINTLRGQFEAQALHSVSGSGVDAQAIFDWARDNKPQELQRAIMDHATQRTVSGYKGLAQDYMNNLDSIDPEAIINAEFGGGISASMKTDSNGRKAVVLSTPRGEVDWKTAMRLGYVNVSSRA